VGNLEILEDLLYIGISWDYDGVILGFEGT
jgi:hypothetical protein